MLPIIHSKPATAGAGAPEWRKACAFLWLASMLLVGGAVRAGEADGTEMRTWTSASGAQVTARFETFEDGMLVLVTEDGRRLSIAPADLSEADAERAAELAEAFADEAPSARIETGPNKLPVFTSGPFAGAHAVYQHALMDAVMDADGRLNLYPKHNGQRIGKPLRMAMSAHYSPPGGRTRGRPVEEFTDPSPAAQQPRQVSVQGILRDGVPFEYHVRFDGAQVTAWGWCDDPADISYPTRYRISVRVPASHAFSPQTPQEERIREVEGYTLNLRELQARGARWTEFNYHESIRFTNRAREARIEAPLWLPRIIRVEARDRDHPLRPWIYAGRSLWQGYTLFMQKSDASARSPTQTISVIVE